MRLPIWPLRRFLRTCPDRIHTDAITHIANHLLGSQARESERLLELNGKRICLKITDTDNFWQFRIEGRRLVRDDYLHPWDVCIRGKLIDFLLLASRAEDPDSLFFARRLSIEGDTETGLHIKNLLDSFDMDWEAHFSAFLGVGPVRAVSRTAHAVGLDHPLQELKRAFHQSIIDMASADDSRERNLHATETPPTVYTR
uniref:Predicted lipid carrier protein YhbT, contains SCP2 domain n=1 Tax=Candidatus Kentrum sp. MB TaxID=2138164 RepID=A0A451B9Z5_9GAMM|nr:MAG: Predicted lipid carrier protein YhbT, contains SCP2 domain [Candidatus Kentron sp. MB]VFK27224.1 MAG: Predicted lipid carrier protein YhbT, contains SCP2 domain [Candidatus Kentron sp. MB]VFK75100.1 MAG: Predicted lipid carrier protein YhbT, contains SCP2 domain [Candidatus Kentron sp. MB]